MASTLDLPYPPRWINAYVFDELCKYDDIGVNANQQMVPIFATSPTNIEEIYKNVIKATNVSEPLVIQYDRLMRFRPSPFYPTKKEQVLYYIYSTSIANVNNANVVISQLLDREDAAAQDLNVWCTNNIQYNKDEVIPYNVYFHNVKVFQIDEVRDIIDPVSARTIFVNKMIIEYDYHARDGSTYR